MGLFSLVQKPTKFSKIAASDANKIHSVEKSPQANQVDLFMSDTLTVLFVLPQPFILLRWRPMKTTRGGQQYFLLFCTGQPKKGAREGQRYYIVYGIKCHAQLFMKGLN